MVIKTIKDKKHDKYLLDELVTKKLTLSKLDHPDDIPSWLSTGILSIFFILLPVNVYIDNPTYITSQTGYPNGGHVFTRIQEAVHVKQLIQNMTFNFWNSDAALGYPLFMGTAPLSTVTLSCVFLLFDRIASPVCITRWIMILLVSLIPISFYKGSRLLMFPRIQSLFVALLSLMINSEMQFGFELNAVLLHGLVGQLFGMLLLPITVAKLYHYGMRMGNKDKQKIHLFLLCLTYLSHCLIGIYCSLLTLITAVIFIVKKEWTWKYVSIAVCSYARLHAGVLMYLSWWVIPSIISYPYMAGRFRYTTIDSMRTTFLNSLVNGDLFDYQQLYQLFTTLVVVAMLTIVYSLCTNVKTLSLIHWNHMSIFKTWLLIVTIVSVALLLLNQYIVYLVSLIFPLKVDIDNNSFLFGVHYTGIILASFTLAGLINLIKYIKLSKTKQSIIQNTLVLIISIFMINNTVKSLSHQVTLVEVSDEFQEKLNMVKNKYTDGRMLVHYKLGTGGAWDITNIPKLTGKPGVFSYTEGYPGSLSTFYLDDMVNNDMEAKKFLSLLRLYNIHYMAVSTDYLNNHVINIDQLKHIITVDDLQFYEIDSDDDPYGYFDFVRIPGLIDGDLYHINMPVLEALDIYPNEALLFVNPRGSNPIRKKALIDIQVYEFAKGIIPYSLLTTWKYDNIEMDSENALSQLQTVYSNSWSNSKVVQEIRLVDEYHVIVNVEQRQKFEFLEHLLLKVTYHPFWRCSYFTVEDTYTLDNQINHISLPPGRTSATINHVTPNLISITLPPGRYHVVFRYRFPGILKILAVFCFIAFLQTLCNINIFKSIYLFLVKMGGFIRRRIICTVIMLYRLTIKTYYQCVGLVLPDKLKLVVSYFSVPVLSLRGKGGSLQSLTVRNITQSLVSLTDGKFTIVKLILSLFQKFKQQPELVINKYHPEIKVITKESNTALSESNSIVFSESNSTLASGDDTDVVNGTRITPDLNKSTDQDSSISFEEIYRSPPTPPKHCKKSIRKKHSRAQKTDQPIDFKFQSRTSPVLGNIMDKLRRNSLSPNKTPDLDTTKFRRASFSKKEEKNNSSKFHSKQSSEVFQIRQKSPQPFIVNFNDQHLRIDRKSANPGPSTQDISTSYETLSTDDFTISDIDSVVSQDIDLSKILGPRNDYSPDQSFSPNLSSSPDLSYSNERLNRSA